jgi:hypothetical protein
VAVLNQLPDSASQIHAFVDERAIGLPISTLPTQINRAARVAFESAAFYISGMAMATYDARPDPDQQRELVKMLIVDPEIAQTTKRWPPDGPAPTLRCMGRRSAGVGGWVPLWGESSSHRPWPERRAG